MSNSTVVSLRQPDTVDDPGLSHLGFAELGEKACQEGVAECPFGNVRVTSV